MAGGGSKLDRESTNELRVAGPADDVLSDLVQGQYAIHVSNGSIFQGANYMVISDGTRGEVRRIDRAPDVETLGDLVTYEKNDLLKFRNFGKKSLTELENLVQEKGLTFGMDLSKYKLDED